MNERRLWRPARRTGSWTARFAGSFGSARIDPHLLGGLARSRARPVYLVSKLRPPAPRPRPHRLAAALIRPGTGEALRPPAQPPRRPSCRSETAATVARVTDSEALGGRRASSPGPRCAAAIRHARPAVEARSGRPSHTSSSFAAATWRDRRGRPAHWPDLMEATRFRMTRAVLAGGPIAGRVAGDFTDAPTNDGRWASQRFRDRLGASRSRVIYPKNRSWPI